MAGRAITTGASGTVGSRLAGFLRRQGMEVIPWDRRTVPVDDYWAMERFVRESAPEVLFHLATASQPTGRPGESWLINYEWTSELAWITRTLGIRFVFSSTALVFSNDARAEFEAIGDPARDPALEHLAQVRAVALAARRRRERLDHVVREAVRLLEARRDVLVARVDRDRGTGAPGRPEAERVGVSRCDPRPPIHLRPQQRGPCDRR